MEIKKILWKNAARSKYKNTAQWYYYNMGKKAALKFSEGIIKDIYRIKSQPYIGSQELLLIDQPIEFRSLVSHKNAKIIYYIDKGILYIVDLWDCRQNTDSLKKNTLDSNK